MNNSDKTKDETIKISCYLDKKLHEEAKKKATEIGLSLSAYMRFLIKKDLTK